MSASLPSLKHLVYFRRISCVFISPKQPSPCSDFPLLWSVVLSRLARPFVKSVLRLCLCPELPRLRAVQQPLRPWSGKFLEIDILRLRFFMCIPPARVVYTARSRFLSACWCRRRGQVCTAMAMNTCVAAQQPLRALELFEDMREVGRVSSRATTSLTFALRLFVVI